MAFYSRGMLLKFCSAFALGCLLGTSALAQNFETSYLPGINFSKYHTYKWVPSKRQHPDPTVDAQIKESFDTQLAARGLMKIDGTADLDVDYQTAIKQQEAWEVYEDWTDTGLLGSRAPKRRKVIINTGTIFLDMYDTAAKQLVWSGSASKTLEPNSNSQDRQKIVDKAAKKLLENFPPK